MQMLLVTPRRYFFGAISNQISIFVHINLIVIIGISISNSFTTVLRPFITIYTIFGLVRDSLIKFSVIIRYISDNRVACFFFDSGNMGVLDNVCKRRDQNGGQDTDNGDDDDQFYDGKVKPFLFFFIVTNLLIT